MRIPAKTSVASCEAYLRKIQEETVADLVIPHNLKFHLAGGEASWAQFLLTWASSVKEPIFRNFLQTPSPEQIEAPIANLYGLIAALCGGRVLDIQNSMDLSQQTMAAALKRLEVLQGGDPGTASKGPKIEIVAADHLGKGKPLFFYQNAHSDQAQLRDRSDFVRMARYLIGKVAPTRAAKLRSDKLERAVGNLLYELIKNTEEHAKMDLDGGALPISIRALQIAETNVDLAALENTAGGDVPMAEYFDALPVPLGGVRHNLLVFSVLDSGPGFAQTWTNTPLNQLSLDQELEATLDCFTERTRKGHDRFGQGLPLVRSLLNECGGFLRLRTGRTCLYYDAFKSAAESEEEPIRLVNWRPYESPALAPVIGALITVIIPMDAVT